MLWILFAGGIFDNAGPAEQLLRSGGGLTIKMVKASINAIYSVRRGRFAPTHASFSQPLPVLIL